VEDSLRLPTSHCGPSYFLTKVVPPSSLQQLRSLELNSLEWDCYSCALFISKAEREFHWPRTLNTIRGKLHLRSLNLTLSSTHITAVQRDSDFSQTLTRGRGIELVKKHIRPWWPAFWGLRYFHAKIYFNEGVTMGYYLRRDTDHHGAEVINHISYCIFTEEWKIRRTGSLDIEGVWVDLCEHF